MTQEDMQSKLQKLELDTIRVVTELQKDVQSLTKEVANLAEMVKQMSKNYVTLIQYNEDQRDLRQELAHAKKIGIIKQIVVGLLSSVMTAVVVYEIMQIVSKN